MQRFAELLAGDDEAAQTWRANPPTPHDLRRTTATPLAALGVPKEDRDSPARWLLGYPAHAEGGC